jgi:hypothetical protein
MKQRYAVGDVDAAWMRVVVVDIVLLLDVVVAVLMDGWMR